MIRRETTRIFLVPVVSALLFSGCATQDDVYDLAGQERDPFEIGADRPPTAKTLYALGRILGGQGKDEQARYVLTRAIQEDRDFMPPYTDLAEIFLRNGRLDDAIKTLAVGLRLSPKDPILLNNRGMCLMVKGDHLEALVSFTKAHKVIPSNARYIGNMAVASGMLGRYQDAFESYSQVMSSKDAYYNVAILCEANGDEGQADLAYKQTLFAKN